MKNLILAFAVAWDDGDDGLCTGNNEDLAGYLGPLMMLCRASSIRT